MIANLDIVRLVAGREFRHHRSILVAAQRYPADLLRLVGARGFRAGRLAGVLPRFTNTDSSGAGFRDQSGVEIRDQNHHWRILDGSPITAGWADEVIATSHILFLALPYAALPQMAVRVAENAGPGTIIVDTGNYYSGRDGSLPGFEEPDPDPDTLWLSAQLAARSSRHSTTSPTSRPVTGREDRARQHAVVWGLRAALPVLRRNGHGSIVVTAPLAAIHGVPQDPIYTMTKHAVIGLVRAFSGALAQENIRLSVVCPGLVETPLTAGGHDHFRAARIPMLSADTVAEAIAETRVLGRTTAQRSHTTRRGDRTARAARWPEQQWLLDHTQVDHPR